MLKFGLEELDILNKYILENSFIYAYRVISSCKLFGSDEQNLIRILNVQGGPTEKYEKKKFVVLNDSFTPLFNTHTKYWKRFLRDGFLNNFFEKKIYIYIYMMQNNS